jgi:inosose dehydratase
MNLRIGINPLTWTNDDMPELGDEIPLETCLAQAHEAGYAGVELGHKFPRNAEALLPLVHRFGLEVISGWYSSALLTRSVEAEVRALEPHLSLLKAVGTNVLVLCETSLAVHGDLTTPLSKRPRLNEKQWKRLTDGLERLGAHTASRGVRLAYHPHMGSAVQTPDEIDRVMKSCGSDVWLLLDTGHVTFSGGDPIDTARRYGSRVAHVHTKDVRWKVLQLSLVEDVPFLKAVLDGVFTVPGDGCVDFTGVFRELAKAHYDGWLVVEAEQDPHKADPLTYAKLGFQNVAARAREAGLRSNRS